MWKACVLLKIWHHVQNLGTCHLKRRRKKHFWKHCGFLCAEKGKEGHIRRVASQKVKAMEEINYRNEIIIYEEIWIIRYWKTINRIADYNIWG